MKDDQELIELAKKYVEHAAENAAANPATHEILVVIVEPMKKPYKKMIKNDLDEMKAIVGGWIENVFIGKTKKGAEVGIVLNEEGKLLGLPYNRRIIGKAASDNLVGTLFITAYNMQGDNVSLSDEEADFYIKLFSGIEVYL